MEHVSPSLLVVREAAEQLSVTPSRVQNMIADGRLPARKEPKHQHARFLPERCTRVVTRTGILEALAT